MEELEQFLVDENFTLIKWFNLMDASFRRAHANDSDSEDDDDAEWYPNGVKPVKVDVHKEEPEGTISALELRKGLQHLGCGFDETEIGLIMRFMDPNSDGELTYHEVKDAFRKLHRKTEAEVIEEKVGGILMKIEEFMKEKGLRMLNVFQELDADGSGSVTGDELMRGLLRLKEPSGKLKALIKRKNESDAEAERLKAEKERRDAEIKSEIKRAEDAGVGRVLGHLEMFMKEKGLTVTTLCHSIDPDGTGEVDASELVLAVEKMMRPSGASRAALKRTREREAGRLAVMEAKRSKARELMEKMRDMETSGALRCLTLLESFMRKSCMRIVDLFSKMDSSGDGYVTAEELRSGMKKCGLKMRRKDVVLFVRYIDLDGGGEVGMDELEGAIRELRRYNWEKESYASLVSASGAPLPLRCPTLLHIFRSTDCARSASDNNVALTSSSGNARSASADDSGNRRFSQTNYAAGGGGGSSHPPTIERGRAVDDDGFNSSLDSAFPIGSSSLSSLEGRVTSSRSQSPSSMRGAAPPPPSSSSSSSRQRRRTGASSPALDGRSVCMGIMRMRGDGSDFLWGSLPPDVVEGGRESGGGGGGGVNDNDETSSPRATSVSSPGGGVVGCFQRNESEDDYRCRSLSNQHHRQGGVIDEASNNPGCFVSRGGFGDASYDASSSFVSVPYSSGVMVPSVGNLPASSSMSSSYYSSSVVGGAARGDCVDVGGGNARGNIFVVGGGGGGTAQRLPNIGKNFTKGQPPRNNDVKREILMKVKERKFKALHIGVPTGFMK